MALKFNYAATFNSDGYARGDKKVLEALHIRPNTTNTFVLTETLPKPTKAPKNTKDRDRKQHPALTIEDCLPEFDYREGNCIPLPSNVSHNSIYSNIISSFRHQFQTQRDNHLKQVKEQFRLRKCIKKTRLYDNILDDDTIVRDIEREEDRVIKNINRKEKGVKKGLQTKLEAWGSFLKMVQNEYVLSDAFWYMRYLIVEESDTESDTKSDKKLDKKSDKKSDKKLDKKSVTDEITEFLLGRMAKNYIDLFLSVEGIHKESFFKNYFNILSQGVFYSFFYACPKSRDDLNDKMKEKFLEVFSVLFAGIEISNPKDYYYNWYLDLGAGNILRDESTENLNSILPPVVFKETTQVKVIRTQQDLRYSPIIFTYLGAENYQTRNVVKGYQMNFSKISTDKEEVERKFEAYRQIAKKVNQDLEEFKVKDAAAQAELQRELKRMREESWNHQRRLSRRRDEELEKGAHEYANYLVSMLNAHSQNPGSQKL